ncbi:nuclear transport factor 2 family protein [Leifsonia virtsii]|uniref:Nuclear transport factor 2 family protein n=1 Tax=Leifsonia virtsii TaxID=3035915 RepID=A0ABT8IXG9_9MICO|nr:nuclear transport factor 2 family protein [Leifsonia virtsii]MDN4597513.1 nuclear transport factor 2 family protein [Leifsonia virtsii]
MAATDTETVAKAYIQAVGAHDPEALEKLLDDQVRAEFAGSTSDKEAWLTALKRLMPALVRNELREVFTAGDRACVVYDFVTDTSAGAVRCVELLTVVDGRITQIELLLDRAAFAPVNAELAERAKQ